VVNYPSISVVIPNYNGAHLVVETIRCAYVALESSGITDFEIIVTDDGSTDQSAGVVQSNFPEARFIHYQQNTGFSGNMNRGIKLATKDWVLLLNSDVHLSPDYFTSQLNLMEEENTFGVMGLILDADTKTPQDGAKMAKISVLSIDSNKNIFTTSTALPTLFLSGANALIKRKYLVELGGFNELFNPYYSEDVDLGIRAWRSGLALYFQPQAICYHAQSSTIKKLPSGHVRMIAKRNKHFLHFLHLPTLFNWIYLIKSSANALVQLLIGRTIHMRALLHFFQNMKSLRKQRNKLRLSVTERQPLSLLEVKKSIHNLLENQPKTIVRS
jgi:GT2 family glycosyltransferase